MADEANTGAAPANAGAGEAKAGGDTALGAGEAKAGGDTALGGQQGGGAAGGQGEPKKTEPVKLSLPEGVTFPEESLKEYQTLVEKFDPQKGLEFIVKTRDAALLDLQKQVGDQVNKQRNDWLEAAKADKEIGGTAWDATLSNAQKAVSALGGDALRAVLNKTGLGNNPEIIRAFARAGKLMSEDSLAGRNANGGSNQEDLSKLTPEERLAKTAYTTMNPKKEE